MISETYRPDIVKVANDNSIEPPAMLAVVEIESSGSPLEGDGRTPKFLFERHVFYRELKNRSTRAKLQEAVNKGLAHQGWQKGQYSDQRTSREKLTLLERARAVDEECANRACSWGLGQVLGANAEGLGFGSASAMVAYMVQGGVPAQLEVMAAFIKKHNLISALNRHDWATFARAYNGEGYKRNRYDTKLANAYVRWASDVDRFAPRGGPISLPQPGSLAFGARGEAVQLLQSRLKQLGYAVGKIDGIYGSDTRNAVSRFQADHGLAGSGLADATTLAMLKAVAIQPPIIDGAGPLPSPPPSDDALRNLLVLLLQQVLSDGKGLGGQGRTDLSRLLQAIVAEQLKQRSAMGAGGTMVIASSTPPVLTWIDKLFPASQALAGKKTALSVIAGAALGVLQFNPATALPATAAQILATLIGGVGGLGFLSKVDRGVDLLGMIAKKPSALGELDTREAGPPDTRYGGFAGSAPFWER